MNTGFAWQIAARSPAKTHPPISAISGRHRLDRDLADHRQQRRHDPLPVRLPDNAETDRRGKPRFGHEGGEMAFHHVAGFEATPAAAIPHSHGIGRLALDAGAPGGRRDGARRIPKSIAARKASPCMPGLETALAR